MTGHQLWGSQEVDSDVSEHQPQPIRQVRHRRCRTGYGQRPGKSEPSIWLRERAGQGEPVRMTIQHLILAHHLCIWWETRQQSIRIRSKTERGSSPSWTGWPAAERELMSGPCHALQAAHCLANCRWWEVSFYCRRIVTCWPGCPVFGAVITVVP